MSLTIPKLKKYFLIEVSFGLTCLLLLTACGDITGTSNISLPTVTPANTNLEPTSTFVLGIGEPTSTPALTVPTAVAAAPTQTAAVFVLATNTVSQPIAAPSGTTVQVGGVVQQITIDNDTQVILVDNRSYLLTPELIRLLGSRLIVGVPINFTGQFNQAGQIIVINVIQINNQPIMVEQPQPDKSKKGNDNGNGNKNGGNEDQGDD